MFLLCLRKLDDFTEQNHSLQRKQSLKQMWTSQFYMCSLLYSLQKEDKVQMSLDAYWAAASDNLKMKKTQINLLNLWK